MNTKAAVTTPKGLGAIANIQLAGADAAKIIENITRPALNSFNVGQIHVCEIVDGENTIDHVVVGHETKNNFAISCHGNPFITEAIIKLLQTHGVEIISCQALLADDYKTKNTIEAEAKLTQLTAPSLEAVKLVTAQCEQGLAKVATQWLASSDLPQIKKQCDDILADSAKAKFLISGCTAVIAGPPNSGKSTLINSLAGKQKAIVTDIAGTTRDWVGIDCRIGPLLVSFIDTAGLDETLTKNAIDKASQMAAHDMIENADIIIYLNDAQTPLDRSTVEWAGGKTVIFANNKCDLLTAQQRNALPADNIALSASTGLGIDKLCDAIADCLQIKGLHPQTPVCFTQRQTVSLTKISNAKDISDAKTAITQLLNAPISV